MICLRGDGRAPRLARPLLLANHLPDLPPSGGAVGQKLQALGGHQQAIEFSQVQSLLFRGQLPPALSAALRIPADRA